ncbi:hypothetical protein POM88_001105 [Heracleum sosnowskyi]|uniref:Uncharacterized protein n=1 Tax=Heracleum sosnowskyi TaxID=360622 RepID=A0AAD8JFH8_9APIA|nr:hypothetical protein POM88_001105 [Heracleum sosnowskyi]
MAPTNKTMSLTGFTYEKNNFTALVDFEEKNASYHTMMSRLEKKSDNDVNMLNLINYVLPTDNLSKIQRKGMFKEWSFFFDVILKVFSGKISNYDAVTLFMLDIAYMLLSDSFYNLGSLILYELGTKLGNKASRSKNIYYARFFTLLANHVDSNLVIQFPANSKECWVQNKRVLEDLNRLNHNKEVQLVYPPIFNAAQEAQVSQVISSTVPTSIVPSLISSATMEAGIVQQPPTQVDHTQCQWHHLKFSLMWLQ